MLEFDDVYKSFGDKKVLQGLSFEVPAGQVFGFLAANGGGKTTAMRIAMGLLEADSGRVVMDGAVVSPGSVRGVGYMPEERGLYPKEKVRSQLRYFARLHKVPEQMIDTRIDELLEELEVAHYVDTQLQKLSLGNKQRVQIAAALIHRPKLLIFDEPFSGLDPLSVERLSELFRTYANAGATILFSSHQIEIVDRISDRIGIMKGGKIIFEGTSSALKSQGEARVVRVDTAFGPGRSIDDVDFGACPSVASHDGLVLTLKGDHITVEELTLSGLKPSEIQGVSYQENSLLDMLGRLYAKEEE